MIVKQINLYLDKQGKLTGKTLFFWGEQRPSIVNFEPPVEVALQIKSTRKRKRRVTNRD